MIDFRSVQDAAELGHDWGGAIKTTTTARRRPSFLDLSHLPSIQMNKAAATHPLWWGAITFECQKIILAVIFSDISGTAKATDGHGGKGNDSLLLPHSSNIFPFKSFRLQLASLLFVFLHPAAFLSVLLLSFSRMTPDNKSSLLFARHLVPLHNHAE